MHRATKQSGAYMTMTAQGLVRGCRTCKTALSSDMSCPKCGPVTCGTAPISRSLEIDPCKSCGYQQCAPSCARIARLKAEEQERAKLAAHTAELARIEAERQQAALKALQAQQSIMQGMLKQRYADFVDSHPINSHSINSNTLTYAHQWLAQQTATITGTYADSTSAFADYSTTLPLQRAQLEAKPSNFAEYIAQRNGSK